MTALLEVRNLTRAFGALKAVSDVIKEGEEVMVKVISIDRAGKIRLSRKEALAEQAGQAAGQQAPAAQPATSPPAKA